MNHSDKSSRPINPIPPYPDDLDIITQDELADAMRLDFVPADADRYAAMVFQAKAESAGPSRLIGHALGYIMMVSPELEERFRKHLIGRGVDTNAVDKLLEETRAYVASRKGERSTLDNAAHQ